ncbi:Fe2+ transport system protein B [Halanaerobacter jeridensis]|uniref:Fe2+ transport system protein B n=1 Tax=Halanaerobacter jeridensis TaxID=706427 RepID=A0A938XW16_9FIRM|nr:hypothetical protein [Halanaerobacter jeridensis]MBM7557321.1 Fe2+ transport system protein B [Halanaerobacter jeridensis]
MSRQQQSTIFSKIDNLDINHEQIRDEMVKDIYDTAEEIAERNIASSEVEKESWGEKFDTLLTSKCLGFPMMLLMLGIVFWVTIVGANYPSAMLAKFLFWIEGHLSNLFVALQAPEWLHGMLIKGVYRTLAWVISVMLPPMAIFFPIFTLLEDLGLLPRVAFNLDNFFKKAGGQW